MLDAIIHGLTQGLADHVSQQREMNRQREDTEFNRQLALLDQLRTDPRTTPATYGKVLHDMLEMSQSQQGPKKTKSGMSGFLGAHELPASQLLTHIATGTIPVEYTGTPSGQAMLQGLVQNPPTADPMAAHTAMELGAPPSQGVPAPPQGGMPQPGGPQAQGGMVGATPPPSPQGGGMPPPPEPPGTSKMASAAGPLQAEMASAPPQLTPPPNLTGLMGQFGHQHAPEEDQALRYSSEHMFAKGEAEKFAGAEGAESGKLNALISRLRSARTPEEKQLILRQAGIIPSYERKPVMMPDGKVVMGVASRKSPGGYEDENGQDLPGAIPWTPGMVGSATTSSGSTGQYSKLNPGAGVTEVPGTKNVLAGSKVLDNVAGADGKPGKLLLLRDGSRQWVANDAIKDQYIQEDDGQGHMILKVKPTLYQGGSGKSPERGVPTPPAMGAAPKPAAKASGGIPPPPAAPMKNDKGKVAQPGDITKYGKLNVQDEQSSVAVATSLPEIDKAIKLLEESGLSSANDWKSIIKSKIASKLYGDWGIKPSDLQADIFQRVGYARAHLLRGLIGARMPVEIAHIIDEHLAKGSQSPALMYHQLKLLREEELPTKLQTIYDTSRVEPPDNIKKWLPKKAGGGEGDGGDDELLLHLLNGLKSKPNSKGE